MSEILFYHLTESTLEEALPLLLEKSLERGWNVVVQAGSEMRLEALDAHLWTFRDDSFLPHGTAGQAHPEAQPIYLTTGTENPNLAVVRFLVDGAGMPELQDYQRVVFLFDGHHQGELESARAHWRSIDPDAHDRTYWQQTPERRWQRNG